MFMRQSFSKLEVTCLSKSGRARSLGRCGSNSAKVSWAMPKQKQCKGTEDETHCDQTEVLCTRQEVGASFFTL